MHLERNGIQVIEEVSPHSRVRMDNSRRWFSRGPTASTARAVFRYAVQLAIAARAQARLPDHEKGCHSVRPYEATSVPGVFVAGNLIKDVQLAIVALQKARGGVRHQSIADARRFRAARNRCQHVEHPSVDQERRAAQPQT